VDCRKLLLLLGEGGFGAQLHLEELLHLLVLVCFELQLPGQLLSMLPLEHLHLLPPALPLLLE
jgi:hypothetical protein